MYTAYRSTFLRGKKKKKSPFLSVTRLICIDLFNYISKTAATKEYSENLLR
jgi:hypothetical protein